jgi:uncharacterized protein YkwD
VPRSAPTATVETPRSDLGIVSQQIVKGINNARAETGMALLRADSALTQIADQRSADMIARNYFSHQDPSTGQQPLLRYLQASQFAYHFAGENIAEVKNDSGWVPPWLTVAARYTTEELADKFVQDWLGSQEHRANIFNTHYRRTGVALAVNVDGRRIIATQTFAD